MTERDYREQDTRTKLILPTQQASKLKRLQEQTQNAPDALLPSLLNSVFSGERAL
jgi:hypothetical protein